MQWMMKTTTMTTRTMTTKTTTAMTMMMTITATTAMTMMSMMNHPMPMGRLPTVKQDSFPSTIHVAAVIFSGCQRNYSQT